MEVSMSDSAVFEIMAQFQPGRDREYILTVLS